MTQVDQLASKVPSLFQDEEPQATCEAFMDAGGDKKDQDLRKYTRPARSKSSVRWVGELGKYMVLTKEDAEALKRQQMRKQEVMARNAMAEMIRQRSIDLSLYKSAALTALSRRGKRSSRDPDANQPIDVISVSSDDEVVECIPSTLKPEPLGRKEKIRKISHA
eukprot:Blabericola_migrator_1__9588@NODE_522_length_7878_cov_137_466778_g399_i0_p8_GENE_NODE_522_length_7878_cov_137_466778_g399_i0NODE_522_length_7878_cov_137_466778_g399_i0_p8_ORF_typecomplete_len164_score26_90DUF1039/PF06287_11/0_28DUF1039/PF06287_11/1_6e04_NODE_522_length_7878_cov_137_466778_g399_i021282619